MKAPDIKYRIVGMELVFKNMIPFPPEGISQDFLFDVRCEIRINADMKLVIPFVTIQVRDRKTELVLAGIGVSCLFEVEEFEKHILQNEQQLYTVPQILEDNIRPIAISSARGVLFSEFRGTYLHNVVLPVVNPQSLVKDSVK